MLLKKSDPKNHGWASCSFRDLSYDTNLGWKTHNIELINNNNWLFKLNKYAAGNVCWQGEIVDGITYFLNNIREFQRKSLQQGNKIYLVKH